MKNKINLDKKNLNTLSRKDITTELQQLTNYQNFILLDSVEIIPIGYQKIQYYMVFDVKDDLRHKARLVAGGSGIVNEKENICSEVVPMDTLRIVFS